MSVIETSTLWDVIQRKVALGKKNSRGWYDVRCPMCHDTKERGGFLHDGIYTGFSDYNCGAKFRYEEGTGKLSRNAREILEAFGITKDDLTAIRSAIFATAKDDSDINLDELKKIKLFTPEVALPDRCYPLGAGHHDEFQEPLIEYLLSRKIDPLAVRAHFSLDPKFLRRVIIPFYRDGKIIYWQARTIDDVKPRYVNCTASKEAILYGYDRLYSYDPAPLFVCEGVFDAIVLDGICILGSTLNAAKLEILKKCRRRVVFVQDPDGNGDALCKLALENGWEISFFDKRHLDASKMVELYGKPLTMYQLMKNITRDPVMQRIGILNNGKFGTYR